MERRSGKYERVTISWTSDKGPQNVILRVGTDTSLKKVIVESASTESSEWSTFLSGKRLMDLFQKASTYTTSTRTNSITESKIYNLLIHSLTSACIAAVPCETENGGNHAENAESNTLSVTITFINKAVSFLGVSNVVSTTPLKISVKEGRYGGHPTVKALALMRYLCKLVTPLGGTILDPFAGSGTTGEAALLEGFCPILIEREAEYIPDIENRLNNPLDNTKRKPIQKAIKKKRSESAASLDHLFDEDQGQSEEDVA